jgi:hypothetical protein
VSAPLSEETGRRIAAALERLVEIVAQREEEVPSQDLPRRVKPYRSRARSSAPASPASEVTR